LNLFQLFALIMNTENKTDGAKLTPFTLWVMTVATGLVVANIYYNQPLLDDIAKTFKVSSSTAGMIGTLTQIGYATGILFIAPLADMLKRKRLMMIDFFFIILSLLLAAFSPNINILIVASFLIGASSMVTQMLVPMAAHLSAPANRGKTVGTVMSGLLIGILLSRTISGYIGKLYGWHTMYIIAAVLMLIMWVLLYFLLPEIEPDYKENYGKLMRSILSLVKSEPKLRIAAFRGACCFACFSAFWSTLVFLLKQPQFNMGSREAGLFGLLGAAGAIGASAMGQVSDKGNPYKLTTITILMVLASFIVFWFSSHSLAGLIIGVLLLDLGVQATHISNQTLIFSLNAEARNRLNTVYMVFYFIGGASGTYLASILWDTSKWSGVCIIGIIFSITALVGHLLSRGTLTEARQAG
jgi:predicted MFS family arabinose efflux permease